MQRALWSVQLDANSSFCSPYLTAAVARGNSRNDSSLVFTYRDYAIVRVAFDDALARSSGPGRWRTGLFRADSLSGPHRTGIDQGSRRSAWEN